MATIHDTIIDANGSIVSDVSIDIPQQPLDPTGAFATLLVVKNIIDINDAANALHLNTSDLVDEALAWAAAAAIQGA